MNALHRWTAVLTLLLATLTPALADDQNPPKPDDKDKMVAGKSEVLRQVPKKFGTLQAVDAGKRQVTFLAEGDKEAKTWTVNPDGEIKIHGWWGRLEQLKLGDRVWVWFDVNKQKQPKSVLMLADEMSEQDIHGTPPVLGSIDAKAQTITLKPPKGESRVIKLPDTMRVEQKDDQVLLVAVKANGVVSLVENLKLGDKVFVQTADGTLRRIATAGGLETLRNERKAALRERWAKEGLPGTVLFLHGLSGEMELMLDHEAIRWGRSLKNGDKVKLQAKEPIEAQVRDVRPWRERTQLRLVVSGLDQSELTLGQRLQLLMPAPAAEVDESQYPPDLDRPRSKGERVEWFLASTYCSCGVKGDTCTGMFYTLASCNVNACGMPNHIREKVGDMIDQGMTDKQIFDALLKRQGPLMLKPHLLPP